MSLCSADQLNRLTATVRELVVGSALADVEGASYWAYHLGRTGFFLGAVSAARRALLSIAPVSAARFAAAQLFLRLVASHSRTLSHALSLHASYILSLISLPRRQSASGAIAHHLKTQLDALASASPAGRTPFQNLAANASSEVGAWRAAPSTAAGGRRSVRRHAAAGGNDTLLSSTMLTLSAASRLCCCCRHYLLLLPPPLLPLLRALPLLLADR